MGVASSVPLSSPFSSQVSTLSHLLLLAARCLPAHTASVIPRSSPRQVLSLVATGCLCPDPPTCWTSSPSSCSQTQCILIPNVLKACSSLTVALTLLLLFSSTKMASLLPTVQQAEKEMGHCMDAGRISVLLPQNSCQLGQVIKQSCFQILIENEDHNSFLAF